MSEVRAPYKAKSGGSGARAQDPDCLCNLLDPFHSPQGGPEPTEDGRWAWVQKRCPLHEAPTPRPAWKKGGLK